MESEKSSSFKNKKRKFALLLFIIIFFVGNIGFYIQERAKWIYEGQPYPQAKEWLIPANMMLVYGTTITKLPFIDERSFVMKPIIGLQDYFVKKWQENLPDDDAEKYLGWYMFKLRTYILPRTKIVIYGKNGYSFKKTKKIQDKVWNILQALKKLTAKDKEFNEIKYAAFNNLSTLYIVNFAAYWVEAKDDKFNYGIQKDKEYFLNEKKMFKDDEKFKQLINLYNDIKYIDTYYLKNYPTIYSAAQKTEAAQYWIHRRLHDFTVKILQYFAKKDRFTNYKEICTIKKDSYIDDYIISKKWLIKNKTYLKTMGIDVNTSLTKKADDAILKLCQNINTKRN